jgi:hypothetical protein
MPQAKSWEYIAEGGGSFPGDMLRYDACYPMDPTSVIAMFDGDQDPGLRKVRLRGFRPPTTDRWKSFFWSVSQVHQTPFYQPK